MITIVKKNKNLLIWGLVYLAFVYVAYDTSIVVQGLNFQEFLSGNLFNLQKYFFDVSILFIAYLYLVKKPFSSVFFVARCKTSYLLYVILYGLKVCLFYVGYTVVLFLGIPFLNGIPIQYGGSLLLDFVNLFFFLLTIYLSYIFVLLLSGKQMFGVLSAPLVNFVILMVHGLLVWTSEPLAMAIETFFLTSYASIAIVFLAIVVIVFRRKDFLL